MYCMEIADKNFKDIKLRCKKVFIPIGLIHLSKFSGGSRISQRGHQPQGGSTNLLFGQNFSKIVWKWKKLHREEGVPRAPLDLPMKIFLQLSETAHAKSPLCVTYSNIVRNVNHIISELLRIWLLRSLLRGTRRTRHPKRSWWSQGDHRCSPRIVERLGTLWMWWHSSSEMWWPVSYLPERITCG